MFIKSFGRQYCALLKRNVRLKKRRCCSTIMEIVAPLVSLLPASFLSHRSFCRRLTPACFSHLTSA
jgi:hypothetical protein